MIKKKLQPHTHMVICIFLMGHKVTAIIINSPANCQLCFILHYYGLQWSKSMNKVQIQ